MLSDLSSKAFYSLGSGIYNFLSRELGNIKASLNTENIPPKVASDLAALEEMVNWYNKNVIVSGNFLEQKLQKCKALAQDKGLELKDNFR